MQNHRKADTADTYFLRQYYVSLPSELLGASMIFWVHRYSKNMGIADAIQAAIRRGQSCS